MVKSPQSMEIQFWPIDKFVSYGRNPRESDAAVDSIPSPTLQPSGSNQGTQGRTTNASRFWRHESHEHPDVAH
jgi:hypothetical protein